MIKKFYDMDDDLGGGGADTKKSVRIFDRRKTIAATGVPFSDRFSKTGSYDQTRIQNIIKAAKFNGVDPNTAIAVALQETGIGNKDPNNIGANQLPPGIYGKAPQGIDQDAYEFTKLLKEKQAYAKSLGYDDEAHQLQAYNGLGKLANKGDYIIDGVAQKQTYYGKTLNPGESLDLKENPLYGKTIIDLRENLIKNNPDIQKLIGSDTTQPIGKPTSMISPQQRTEWNGILDSINGGATPDMAFDGKNIKPEMIAGIQQEHTDLRNNPPMDGFSESFLKQPIDLDGQMGDNTKQMYYPTIATPDKDYGTDIESYLSDKNKFA